MDDFEKATTILSTTHFGRFCGQKCRKTDHMWFIFVVGFSIFFSRAKKTQKRNAMGNGKVIIVDLLFCLLLGWELRTLTSTLAAT